MIGTTATTQDRNDILTAIIDGAKVYRDTLVGKRFLYYFEGNYIEAEYHTDNYLHLTGVLTSLYAKEFYSKALKEDSKKKLKSFHIDFDNDHPYDLCLRKAIHLDSLHLLSNTALIMLTDVHTDTADFPFALTNADYSICVGLDASKIDIYVPYSLRDEDCFSRSKNQYEVNYIFCNENNSSKYKKIMYSDGKVKLEKLPEEVLAKLELKD